MPTKKGLNLTTMPQFDCMRCINKLKFLVGVNCFNGVSNYGSFFSEGIRLSCLNYKKRAKNVE